MDKTELKNRRKALGLTQKELGSLMGYTENYILMLENGHAPITKPERLNLMLSALEMQAKALTKNPRKKS